MANKYLDSNGLLYFWQKIVNAFVKKDGSKVLSTNDYTTAEKTKLSGLSNYTLPTANESTLGGVKVGANLTITNGVLSADAQQTTIDSALSSTSTNAVQNKVINSALANKVDVVSGKSLSTNDYTTTEKNKLAGLSNYTLPTASDTALGGVKVGSNLSISSGVLSAKDTTYSVATASANGLLSSSDKSKIDGVATGAQANLIENIKVNGIAQSITSKAVNITVPTNNNSLTNGAGYQTSSQVQSLINSAVSNITSFDYSIVTALPSTGIKGTIYLALNGGTGSEEYDEYIWISNKFEHIGTTKVDLTGYLKETDMVAITNAEIDTIVAS